MESVQNKHFSQLVLIKTTKIFKMKTTKNQVSDYVNRNEKRKTRCVLRSKNVPLKESKSKRLPRYVYQKKEVKMLNTNLVFS